MESLTYLRRRFPTVVPIALAILGVTVLLVFVITPTNTFEETTRANVAALKAFTVVAPARSPEFGGELLARIDREPAIESRVAVHAAWVRYPMLVGEAYCPLILIDATPGRDLVRRAGLRLVAGRFPDAEHPGVLLHEDVARARHLRVGDRFGTWVDPEDTTPGAFPIVGLLGGHARLAVGTFGSSLFTGFLAARVPAYLLVYSRPGKKAAMDAFLNGAREGDHPAFQVIDEAYMNRRTERALENVPVVVNFIALSTSTIVAFVVALLALVAFQARHEEFAMLVAIGQRKERLIAKLAIESGLVAIGAWLLGLAIGWTGLWLYDHFVFAPRGLLLRLADLRPFVASALLPVVSTAASLLALGVRLSRMDPIAVLQRRGA